jgi:hypothetical protein
LQIENGIPILPYYEGSKDSELSKLAEFVKLKLVPAADVRVVIKQTFQTQLYHDNASLKDLVAKLQDGFNLKKKG